MKRQPATDVDEPTALTAPPREEEQAQEVRSGLVEEMMELKNRRAAINKEYDEKREAAIRVLLAQLAALDLRAEKRNHLSSGQTPSQGADRDARQI